MSSPCKVLEICEIVAIILLYSVKNCTLDPIHEPRYMCVRLVRGYYVYKDCEIFIVKTIRVARDVISRTRFQYYRRVHEMYVIASCYASGATSALDRGFLLSLVYRFSKPERSNSRDERSVEITHLPTNMNDLKAVWAKRRL